MFARQNCNRARPYAESQGDREPRTRRYLKSHPDYVSLQRLRASIENLEGGDEVVKALLVQLNEMPEYLEAK